MASVCDGGLAPLVEIVEDDNASIWVRMTLIEAWVLRVVEGDAPAGPLEACLLAIGKREAARLRAQAERDGNLTLLEAVACAACDIGAERLREPVLAWFDEQLIDTRNIGRAEFERDLATPIEGQRQVLRERGRSYLLRGPKMPRSRRLAAALAGRLQARGFTFAAGSSGQKLTFAGGCACCGVSHPAAVSC